VRHSVAAVLSSSPSAFTRWQPSQLFTNDHAIRRWSNDARRRRFTQIPKTRRPRSWTSLV